MLETPPSQPNGGINSTVSAGTGTLGTPLASGASLNLNFRGAVPAARPGRGPDTSFDGFDFWLEKLDRFNGNYEQAEMVRAFISSIEYRERFGS